MWLTFAISLNKINQRLIYLKQLLLLLNEQIIYVDNLFKKKVFHFRQKKFYSWFSELVIQVDRFRYDMYKKIDIDLAHHQIGINDNNDLLQKENQFKKETSDSIQLLRALSILSKRYGHCSHCSSVKDPL
jgi:hypothetical protein